MDVHVGGGDSISFSLGQETHFLFNSDVPLKDTVAGLERDINALKLRLKDLEAKHVKETENDDLSSRSVTPPPHPSRPLPQPSLGTILEVKCMPIGSDLKTTYRTIEAEENFKYAIVACYDEYNEPKKQTSTYSEKLDPLSSLANMSLDIPDGVYPTLIFINNDSILRTLEKISGIELPQAPCMMIRPFKLLATPQYFEKDMDTTDKKPQEWACLLSFREIQLGPLIRLQNSIRENTINKISFDHLWYLFKPGTMITQNGLETPPRQQAWEIAFVRGGRPSFGRLSRVTESFLVGCKCVDFNGTLFYGTSTVYEISPFDGERYVDQLPLLRLDSALKLPITFDYIMDRRRRLMSLRYGHAWCTYTGSPDSFGSPIGNVFIDSQAAFAFDPSRNTSSPASEVSLAFREEIHGIRRCLMPGCTNKACPHFVFNDNQVDAQLYDLNLRRFESDVMGFNEGVSNPTRLWLATRPRVWAYSLKMKTWYLVDMDELEPVSRDESAFEKLVIPSLTKQLLLAAFSTHDSSDTTDEQERNTDEILPDQLLNPPKQGLVIFLYGPPGAGKTATVESLARHICKPLYPITCGELDDKPSEFEKQLRSHLSLAEHWGCIVLLDDAEVYLSERDDNINKNRIVSIFLRQLDKFNGIMVLTSNREGLIDEALKSRIHIALRLPRLNRETTRKLWEQSCQEVPKKYQGKQGGSKFSRSQIMRLCMRRYDESPESGMWNGRQIKNIFKVAAMLARYESKISSDGAEKKQPRLTEKHVRTTTTMMQSFEEYLKECRGNDAKRAAELSIRVDDYEAEVSRSSKSKSRKSRYDTESSEPFDGTDSESESESKSESKSESDEEATQVRLKSSKPKVPLRDKKRPKKVVQIAKSAKKVGVEADSDDDSDDD